jgi:hypothetical protein
VSTGERRTVLLLTATIDPGATPMVARGDPAVRLQDYTHALEAWLNSRAARRVVFCENSGHDLTALKSVAAHRCDCEVEFLSFSGNHYGRERGKGYSELKIIEHAIERSELIAESEVIIKCSGRLTVRNATTVLRAIATTQFDIMCFLRQHLAFADSRLFAATPLFIREYFSPRIDMIDDFAGIYFEHALACATARALADRRQWRPFPVFPRIEGVSGTDGTVMTDSPLKSATKALYHQLRRFVYQR